MSLGKAMRIAAGLNRLANVPERPAASGLLADSPGYLCNQSPCVSQRLINPTFEIIISRQCGFPQNRDSETAVDRFELSRRGRSEQLGSELLHGDMEMLRPAAAFIGEGMRPLALISGSPPALQSASEKIAAVLDKRRAIQL